MINKIYNYCQFILLLMLNTQLRSLISLTNMSLMKLILQYERYWYEMNFYALIWVMYYIHVYRYMYILFIWRYGNYILTKLHAGPTFKKRGNLWSSFFKPWKPAGNPITLARTHHHTMMFKIDAFIEEALKLYYNVFFVIGAYIVHIHKKKLE